MPSKYYRKTIQVKGHKKKVNGKIIQVKSYPRKQRFAHKTRKRKPIMLEKDFRGGTEIVQHKKAIRERTMIKEFPPHMIKSFKELARNNKTEYSIGIDFERYMKNPEKAVILKGGLDETITFNKDFECFGHTHPGSDYARPSVADLHTMHYLEPEFIIAGNTGDMKIFNIENKQKWEKYLQEHPYEKNKHRYAITMEMIDKEIKKKKYEHLHFQKGFSPRKRMREKIKELRKTKEELSLALFGSQKPQKDHPDILFQIGQVKNEIKWYQKKLKLPDKELKILYRKGDLYIYPKKVPKWMNPTTLLETKEGRDIFYNITGVKAYKVKGKTYVQMIEDNRAEKIKYVPTLSEHYLRKYHHERYVEARNR